MDSITCLFFGLHILGKFLTMVALVLRVTVVENAGYVAGPTGLFVLGFMVVVVYPYRFEIALGIADADTIGAIDEGGEGGSGEG